MATDLCLISLNVEIKVNAQPLSRVKAEKM